RGGLSLGDLSFTRRQAYCLSRRQTGRQGPPLLRFRQEAARRPLRRQITPFVAFPAYGDVASPGGGMPYSNRRPPGCDLPLGRESMGGGVGPVAWLRPFDPGRGGTGGHCWAVGSDPDSDPRNQ